MAKLTINVPDDIKDIVVDRDDIDWEDIIANTVRITTEVYPDKVCRVQNEVLRNRRLN